MRPSLAAEVATRKRKVDPRLRPVRHLVGGEVEATRLERESSKQKAPPLMPRLWPRGCLTSRNMLPESITIPYDLPDNAVANTFSNLCGKDLSRAICVCKQWARTGTRDQGLWKLAFERDYSCQAFKREDLTWRQQYRLEMVWRLKGKPAYRVYTQPRGHGSAQIACVGLSKRVLVVGDSWGGIHVWDVKTRDHKRVVRLGKKQTVTRCLHVKEGVVVSGCEDGTVRVWDTESLKCTRLFRGHAGPVLAVHFGVDVIVSGSEDNSMMIWDLKSDSDAKVRVIQGFSSPVEFLQVSGRRVVGGTVCSVGMWNMDSRVQIKMIGIAEEGGQVNKVLFDGCKVAIGVSGDNFQCIEVWDVEGNACERIHSIYVSSLACFTLDGVRIIGRKMGSDKICMWDLRSGKRIKTLGEQDGSVMHLAVFGKKLVTASSHQPVELREWGISIKSLGRHPQVNEAEEGETSGGCFNSECLAKFSRQKSKLMQVFHNLFYTDGNGLCMGG